MTKSTPANRGTYGSQYYPAHGQPERVWISQCDIHGNQLGSGSVEGRAYFSDHCIDVFVTMDNGTTRVVKPGQVHALANVTSFTAKP